MSTIGIIILILGGLSVILSRIKPTVNVNENPYRSNNNTSHQFSSEHYNSIPYEFRQHIEEGNSYELAEIILYLERENQQYNLNVLLKAIDYKNPSLALEISSHIIQLNKDKFY